MYCDFGNIRFSQKCDPSNSRYLDTKWPDEKLQYKWLVGNKEPMINLRLTAVWYSAGATECRWNFILSNGRESKLSCDSQMTKHLLPNTPIRKVVMTFFNDANFALKGLKLYGENGEALLDLGKENSNYKVKEFVLGEDERIVGFVSRNGGNARHYDF